MGIISVRPQTVGLPLHIVAIDTLGEGERDVTTMFCILQANTQYKKNVYLLSLSHLVQKHLILQGEGSVMRHQDD